jgi:hypothetical protein
MVNIYGINLKKSIRYLDSIFTSEGDAMPEMVKFLLKDVLAEVTEIQRLLADYKNERDAEGEKNCQEMFGDAFSTDPQEAAMVAEFAKEEADDQEREMYYRRLCNRQAGFIGRNQRMCESHDFCGFCIKALNDSECPF